MNIKPFSIVIPLYNEEKNIINLYNEISISLSSISKIHYEIIFVNDCSTDNSSKILDILSKKHPKIKIITNNSNLGQSFSIKSGVTHSAHNTIVTIDGDGQNNPVDIKKLLNTYFNSNYKLVGGIRKIRKDSLIKIISSKLANKIRGSILNDNCIDSGCGLKIFDKNIFLKFEYFNGIHRFLPALFLGYGYETHFLVVDHRKRQHGYSKYGTFIRLISGIKNIIKVKKIINQNRNQ